MKKTLAEIKKQNKHYCIFEQKICVYAKNYNNAFECTAQSDSSMTCKK